MAVDANPFLASGAGGGYSSLAEPDLLDGQTWPQASQPQGWSRKRKAACGLAFTVIVFLGGSGAGWHFREMAMKPPAPATPRLPPPALPPGASYPPVPPSPPPTSHTFTCAPANDPIVCAALGDIFYATNGMVWANNPYSTQHWMEAATGIETDFCTLGHGQINAAVVSCVDGTLSSITFNAAYFQSEFVGVIPNAFGSLTSLTSLQLTYATGLTGTLPAAMGGLAGLVTLDFKYSGLIGTVPASWASLTSLTYFSLAYTHLCGTVPPNLAVIPPMSSKPLPPC